MLEDDELDFEDFGELGEFEGQEMTTEELEKQLAMEFPDLPIEDNVTEQEENSTKKEEEGEIKQQDSTLESTPKPPVKKTESTEPSGSRPRYQQQQEQNSINYKRSNNNNYYNQQQQQPMMGMK